MAAYNFKNEIVKVTEGVFAYTFDFSLWTLVYFGEIMTAGRRSGAVDRAVFSADRFLEKFNYQTLKAALVSAQRKGFVKGPGRGRKGSFAITREGKRRLNEILPQYDEERIWDGRIYLVTYDIPEKRRRERDLLRKYAKKMGMGLLQKSVWIAPYNPRTILKEFVSERTLPGTIIVSDIGEDGSIGEEDLKTLLVRVYKLKRLNERYQEFIKQVKNKKKPEVTLAFKYLAILKDDPQLPFELLPSWWQGDKAYQIYKAVFEEMTI